MVEEQVRLAGWLDVAAIRSWPPGTFRIGLHEVIGCEHGCTAVTVDERWVCCANGAVTVFEGHAAAGHFLDILGLAGHGQHREGEARIPEGRGRDCLGLGARGLCPCRKRQAAA